MPDIFAEVARDWLAAEHAMRHLMHHGAPQPAATPEPPALPHNGTQEEPPMSLQVLDEIADHIKQAAAKFEQLDREAQAKLAAVQANPATAEIFDVIGQLTHLPPTSLANGIGVLRMILQLAGGDQAAFTPPQAVPAGPVVAGQA